MNRRRRFKGLLLGDGGSCCSGDVKKGLFDGGRLELVLGFFRGMSLLFLRDDTVDSFTLLSAFWTFLVAV